MKTALRFALLLLSAGPVLAQDPAPARPPQADGRAPESCREDARKYCTASPAPMQQACLVLNWNRISDACQNAVARPSRGGGE